MNEEIMTLIYDELRKYGYNIQLRYPEVDNVRFPMIVFREIQQSPRQTKSFLIGKLNVVIDLYFPYDDVNEVSEAISVIPTMLRYFDKPHKWKLNGSNSRLIADTSNNERLWHGMIDLEYLYY